MDVPHKTLLLLQRDQQVLLARKKTGFGKGKIVAVGGAVEAGETMLEAAIRETLEEVHVVPLEPRQVADIRFTFPHQTSWTMQVAVFNATDWQGEPVESAEVVPAWYNVTALPFAEMWADARYWLPQVLAGQFVRAEFVYKDDVQIDRERSWVEVEQRRA